MHCEKFSFKATGLLTYSFPFSVFWKYETASDDVVMNKARSQGSISEAS